MNKFRTRLTTLFAALTFPALVLAQDWSLAKMNAHIDQTNFVVNEGCSGTLIDKENRYILTANHCIQAQYETIEIEKIDNEGVVKKEKVRRLKDGTVSQLDFSSNSEVIRTVTYTVKVVKGDKDRDLALLQITSPIPNTQAAQIACYDPVRGESVWIVGNPMGTLYSSVVQGVVSSLQRTYGFISFSSDTNAKNQLMQISGGVIGGNSGGAAYDSKGRLIGVPVLGHRMNEVVAFAVPRAEIKTFLNPLIKDLKCAE